MSNQQYDTDDWVEVFTAVFNQIIVRRQVEEWQERTNESVKRRLQALISLNKRWAIYHDDNSYSLESCKPQCIEAGFNPGTDFKQSAVIKNPFIVSVRFEKYAK